MLQGLPPADLGPEDCPVPGLDQVSGGAATGNRQQDGQHGQAGGLAAWAAITGTRSDH